MSRRSKRKKSRKRLAYGVIVAAFIFACLLAYFFLHQSNQPPSNQTSQPKAAIVDHLSFRNETANQTFVDASKNILKDVGFDVDYYGGNEVDVTFYKYLLRQGYSLIVLRVHSAIIGNGTELGLFTSEPFNESKFDNEQAPYFLDVYHKRLVEAYFSEQDPIHYFAIAPGFIEEYGTFQKTVIIMMGCDGLKYNRTAEAFIKKGKVCIGWDGLVSTLHTDHATTCLLQHLSQGDTIEKAVNKTMNEVGPEKMYNSTTILKYYPGAAGSYTIQLVLGISSMDTVKANVVLVKEEKKGTSWL